MRPPGTAARRVSLALVGLIGLVWVGIATADGDESADQVVYPIDVLLVHPNAPEDHLQTLINWGRTWGETEMAPFVEITFERVTQIYQDSGVPVSFSAVHTQEIDLSSIDADWKRLLSLALMNSELNNPVYTPYLDVIEGLRDAYQADVVVYWRERNDGGPTANGAGSIGGGEDEAYVHVTYGGMNAMILAHELGHLLGGQHSDGLQGEAFYSFNGDGSLLREYRTVMTVAYPLEYDMYKYLWRFSDPEANVVGETTCGNLSGVPESCSFDDETPLGDEQSHVVPVLTAMAPVVSDFRDGTPPLHTICGDGLRQGLESCDDGANNGTGDSCCTSECAFKPNGPASCDGELCTHDDTCTDGVCSAGTCRTGEGCSACGGTCDDSSGPCTCVF